MMDTKQLHANDLMAASKRVLTVDGFLQVEGVLSRTGIQTYSATELGLDGDPQRPVRLYRSPSEVFKTASIRSFDGAPLTNDHPDEAVTAANWSRYAVGDVRNTRRAGDFVVGDLTIRTKAAIDSINGGKTELSNGYRFTLDLTPGMTPDGQAYDGLQKNITGNHVAIVTAGRCGSACRVSDSQTIKDNQPMTTQKLVVDGIPVEVSDTAAAVIGQLQTARDAALASVKTARDELAAQSAAHADAVTKLAADHVAALDAMRKDVMTPDQRDSMVRDFAATLTEAKRLAPQVTHDGKTCHDIRKEVIAAVTASDATCKAVAEAVLLGKSIEAADADMTKRVFGAVGAAKSNAKDAANAALVMGGGKASALTGNLSDSFYDRLLSGNKESKDVR